MIKTQQPNPQIFTIWSDEIEGRIDPHFYRAEFIEIENRLEKTKYEKLKNICEDIKNGSTPEGGVFENSGIPYFRSQDFKLFNFEINQYINLEFHKKISRSSIKFGDVLLAVVGATLGVVGYVPNRISEGNINQNVARLRVKDKKINSEYLAIFLSSSYGQKQIQRQATVTTQAYLNNEQLGEIQIPLPPLQIQNKIVSIMSKAYEEKKRKEIKAGEILSSIDDFVLKELGIKMPEIEKEMVFEVWSDEVENGRIDPYFYSSIFMDTINLLDNLKTEAMKLGEVVEIFSGARPKGGVGNILEGIPSLGGEHVLSSGEIKTEKLKFIPVDFHRSHLDSAVKINDVLLVKDGATTGKVGIIPKNYPYKDCNINEHVFAIRIKDKKIIPEYIFAFLNSGLGQSQIKREITGATVTGLTRESVKNLQIPILPLNIQKKISEKIELYYSQSKTLQKEAKEVLEKAKEKVEKMILK